MQKNNPGLEINKAHQNIIRFTPKKLTRLVHYAPIKYNVVSSMREEIDFFAEYLEPASGVAWEFPIAYLI